MKVWQGQCGVCEIWFQHTERTDKNPSPSGTLCPECRRLGRRLVGVINWEAVQTKEDPYETQVRFI